MCTKGVCSYNNNTNSDIIEAIATINEHNISGVIRFTQLTKNGQTAVSGEFNVLDKGVYRIYIHEFGDLSKGCISTGDRYNPNKKNGDINCDLSNITTISANKKKFNSVMPAINLTGQYSIIGRAIVIYRDPDHSVFGHGCQYDILTKSCCGTRIASGVIGLTESTIYKN